MAGNEECTSGSANDVNTVNKKSTRKRNQKFVNTTHVNRINPLAAGSAIGSQVMNNILGQDTGRKRKPPQWQDSFHMSVSNQKKSNETGNEARSTTSFFNADKTVATVSTREEANRFDKILPDSQPLSSSPTVTNTMQSMSSNIGRTVPHNNVSSNTYQQQRSSIATNVPQARDEENDDPNCPVCKEEVMPMTPGIVCDTCKTWFHRACLDMSQETYDELSNNNESWFCLRCLSIRANKIKWGDMEGEELIQSCITNTYQTVTKWKKNLFMVRCLEARQEGILSEKRPDCCTSLLMTRNGQESV